MTRWKSLSAPRVSDLKLSIDACIVNGNRLLDDAMRLEFEELGGTRFMVSILAQEEYSKAFLLFLVQKQIVPWTSGLLRAMNNHTCKHLVAIVMEYLDPTWETLDDLKAIFDAETALEGAFPKPVSSALNILYFQKLNNQYVDDGDQYDRTTLGIARGDRDKVKQNAAYVRIDRSGRVQNNPLAVTFEDSEREYERARRYFYLVSSLIANNGCASMQFAKLEEAMKIVFWQDQAESNVEAR